MSRVALLPLRVLAGFLLVGLSLSSLFPLLLPVSSSSSTTGVASDAEQVVGVSSSGSPSLSTLGGQKLIEDNYAKFLAVYVDWAGKLSITYADSNPSSSGAWSASAKSPGTTTYAYPAGVLVNSTSLRIIAENVTGTGLGHPGQIVDVPVTIQRDTGNNIVGLSFGGTRVLDGSHFAQFPTATLAHNGDILAAWNWFNGSSRVKTLRWNHTTGSWTSFTGLGSSPDDAIVDGSGLAAIFPSMIERPDNFNVYVTGNYDNSGPSNLVFNKATFNGSAWSWGTQSLSYETNAAHGIEDSASQAWDPVKSLVVVAYRITGANSYGVFTLDSSDNKTHLNTPSLPLSTGNYGSIIVNGTSEDYYLFLLDAATDEGTGSVAYTKAPSGAGNWNTTLTWIDSGSNNRGVSLRRVGSDKSFDLLYENEGTVPATIKLARVTAGFLPPALVADFTFLPATPSPGQPTTFLGVASGGVPPYSFSWSFGDGAIGLGTNMTHTYTSAGMYTVRMNVTDSVGVAASRQHGLVATTATFEFAGAGDWDFNPQTKSNWASLSTSGVNFTLALGDFLYHRPNATQNEQVWCNNFKANVPNGNVEIIVGNHDTFEENRTMGASINKFVLYCPFTLGLPKGTYGFQYYFDYPSRAPLARFIMIDPAIWMGNSSSTAVFYGNGSPAQQWVAAQIDGARAEGIPWVIVGMHKDCISTGREGCEIGPNFMNFLINKRVDLVFQGHDHNYQRSKQLTCATDEVYVPSCVVNDGSTGLYQKGAGAVFLIDGTGGGGLDPINATDGDYGYFASTNSTTWGYTKFNVSASAILSQFVPTTGGFKDTWSIKMLDPAPAWPAGTLLSATDIAPRSLTLTWTPAVDNVQVSAYKLYLNGTLLANLPGSITSYNASGLTPLVHYLFQVQAGNPSGNWTVNGPSTLVFTDLRADVNHDCRIDIFDLVLVGLSFGSRTGDSTYNPDADVNGDGNINILDLVLVGLTFNQSC